MVTNSVKRKIVICVSNDSYDADIWTNKQHLMHRLSKTGKYFVIYIDQGLSTRYIKKLWSEKRFLSFFRIIKKRNNNLITVSLILPLIKGHVLKKISWFLIAQFCNFRYRNEEIIYWIYQPQAYYLTRFLSHGVTLYDCVDEFATQPFYKDYPKRRKELEIIEPKLTKMVDYVTTTSYAIFEDKKNLNENIKYIHNVGDFQHFSNPNLSISINETWKLDTRCKVLYTGVIDNYKTDINLILKVAELTKNSHIFVLVGPNRIGDKELEEKVESAENIRILGYRSYSVIPVYLYEADLLWLPYISSSHTERVFPLKIFEYLSSGKPVIAKNLPSLNEYSDYLYVFDDIKQLMNLLNNVKTVDSEEKRKGRLQLASKNTWELRLQKILDFIGE